MRYPRFPAAAPLRRAILAFLALLTLAPDGGLGYVVYLKDGSTITAKGKYRIENGRAIITLPNGTQSFVPRRPDRRQAHRGGQPRRLRRRRRPARARRQDVGATGTRR